MVPYVLKQLFVPGSYPFLLMSLAIGVALLYRRKNGGRAGRLWLTAVVLSYWLFSTPVVAVTLVSALNPDYQPVRTKADARGSTAIVMLSAGTEKYRSRGDLYSAATREGALRVLETARLYRLLDGPIVIVSGGYGSETGTDADQMAAQLHSLGVPEARIVREGKSANTREHALFLPVLLRQHGVERFVLVTSHPHMQRALRVFRAVGLSPVPSIPEVYVRTDGPLDFVVPDETARQITEQVFYDKGAWVYYWLRGWL